MEQAVRVCFSVGFSNRNKSFKNQHTRRGGVRRSKGAPSIIGRNLFAHFHPSEDSSVFRPISNDLLRLRLRIMHISRWARRGSMDGIFILSLRRSARFSTSGKDERGPGRGGRTATRLRWDWGWFPFVRSHAAREVVEPDVFTLLHFYLSIWKKRNSRTGACIYQQKKKFSFLYH